MSSFDLMNEINKLKNAAKEDGASGAFRAISGIVGDTTNLRTVANSLKKSLIDPNLSTKVRERVQNIIDSGFDILDETTKANPDKASVSALIELLKDGYDRTASVSTACKMLGYDDLSMWAETSVARPYDAENEQLTAVVMTLMKRRLPDWKYILHSGFARIESPDFKSESWAAGDQHGMNVLQGSEYIFKAEKTHIALLGAVLQAVEKEAPVEAPKKEESKEEDVTANTSKSENEFNIPTETEVKQPTSKDTLHIPIENKNNTNSASKDNDLNIGVEN